MPNIDVAKLVGAASAPVALIIASSIFLSNLGAKYALLSGAFREVSHELREKEDKDSLRGKSVNEQVKLYSGRLQILMRATLCLGIAILCFITTVLLTGVSVLFPENKLWPLFTAVFSFGGLLILGVSVVLGIAENHDATKALILETSEFPGTLPEQMEKGKQDLHVRTAQRAQSAFVIQTGKQSILLRC